MLTAEQGRSRSPLAEIGSHVNAQVQQPPDADAILEEIVGELGVTNLKSFRAKNLSRMWGTAVYQVVSDTLQTLGAVPQFGVAFTILDRLLSLPIIAKAVNNKMVRMLICLQELRPRVMRVIDTDDESVRDAAYRLAFVTSCTGAFIYTYLQHWHCNFLMKALVGRAYKIRLATYEEEIKQQMDLLSLDMQRSGQERNDSHWQQVLSYLKRSVSDCSLAARPAGSSGTDPQARLATHNT